MRSETKTIRWRAPEDRRNTRIGFYEYISILMPIKMPVWKLIVSTAVGLVVFLLGISVVFKLWPFSKVVLFSIEAISVLTCGCLLLSLAGYVVYRISPVSIAINDRGVFMGAAEILYSRIEAIYILTEEAVQSIRVKCDGRSTEAVIAPGVNVGEICAVLENVCDVQRNTANMIAFFPRR